MRWIFWIFGLFALAIALAFALRVNIGYALLVLPPYRVELSLNLLLLLLVLGFTAAYLLLRFVFGALELPQKVREFRARRARENSSASMLAAVRAFFEGRYGRAEKAAVAAIEFGDVSGPDAVLSAVLAARAAHEQRHFEQRDGYLARAVKLAPEDATMRIIAEAGMLLDQRRYQDALVALGALPEKHTTGLRLELRARQQAGHWDQTLPLIDQLERRGVFDAEHAAQLRHHAHGENLKRKARDHGELDDCWQKIPAQQRRAAQVAAAAAQCYMALGEHPKAAQIIEESLADTWGSEIVGLYADCEGADTIRQIERAERWLTNNPRDAVLLFTLGKLCARQGLWGKAQSYLEASVSIEARYSAHLELAHLFESLGKSDEARRHYRESLELAVNQLKQISGGRRKALLH